MAKANSLSGVVKSYNGLKGFGFISCESVQGDVFFMKSDLPEDAREMQGKSLEGSPVALTAEQQADGRMKATSVQICSAGGGEETLPGVIKTFNDKNGYGFISSSCVEGDVRFDRTSMPGLASFPGSSAVGQMVLFQYQALADGKLRASKVDFQSGGAAKGCGKGKQAGYGMMAPYSPVVAWGPPPAAAWGGGKGGWGGPPQQQFGMVQQALYPDQYRQQKGMQKGGGGAGGGGMITGTVKSFSDKNGYGFITCGGPQDIKFGVSDLIGGLVAAGATVRFKMQSDVHGRMSAKEVSPAAAGGQKRPAAAMGGAVAWGGPPQMMKTGPVTTTTTGQWVNGTIKSFNLAKGFGFISSPEVEGDVFFMRSDLPQGAESALAPGGAASFELMQTNDGKLRASGVQLG